MANESAFAFTKRSSRVGRVRATLAASAILGGALGAQKMSPWAFHSPVAAVKRISAVDRLQALLENKATATNGFKAAATRLRNEAIVFEPLTGGNHRVLRVGKITNKSLWGVMPVFPLDAKVSKDYKDFLQNKKSLYGLEPDNPVLVWIAESPKLESALPGLARLILDAPKN